MNDPTIPVGPSLIPCASCSKGMSTDADACPACGGANSWMHPTLAKVIAHLNVLPYATQYEARGHRMVLHCSHQSPRQAFGSLLMFLGMGGLVLGFFFPPLLMIGVMAICVGGLLTMFGLSATTRHELSIDLRVPGAVIGTTDRIFWKDVLAILEARDGPTLEVKLRQQEPPLWS